MQIKSPQIYKEKLHWMRGFLTTQLLYYSVYPASSKVAVTTGSLYLL